MKAKPNAAHPPARKDRPRWVVTAALVCALAFATTVAHAAEALPSWNDGAAKKSILEFVAKVTKEGSPVSLDYYDKSPFKFNGKIEQVHVKYVAAK